MFHTSAQPTFVMVMKKARVFLYPVAPQWFWITPVVYLAVALVTLAGYYAGVLTIENMMGMAGVIALVGIVVAVIYVTQRQLACGIWCGLGASAAFMLMLFAPPAPFIGFP
jgi:membrane protein YdbS with pleckstrin-like domain